MYKFDLYTNELSLILTNKRFPVVITDNDMRIRMAIEEQEDGTTAYFRFVLFYRNLLKFIVKGVFCFSKFQDMLLVLFPS